MIKFTIKILLLTFLLITNVNATLLGATNASASDLSNGMTENNIIVGFNERQNVSVNENQLLVDYLKGVNFNIGHNYTGVMTSNSGLTIAAGTYDSHLLHFDPVGSSGGVASNANGNDTSVSFLFDGIIEAVIVGTQYLNGSDALLGNALAYNNHIDRRFEPHDLFTFTGQKTLTVNLAKVSSGWIDNIRVVTSNDSRIESVPEPTVIGLFAFALLALFIRRHRQ